MALTTPSSLTSNSLLRHSHSHSHHHHHRWLTFGTLKPISGIHSTDPTKPPSISITTTATTKWNLESWKAKKAFQLPEYPDQKELESVLQTLSKLYPIVFAGEARSLEERIDQAALGNAFLLQGGDCAESFKEFTANNIHDTSRVMLQMGVVLTFGDQMPVVKVWIS